MGNTQIRVGIGGWTYAPWRGLFYPPGLVQRRELEYASRQLTTIEINGTFYRTQTPRSFAQWRDQTPEDFIFTLKATRHATTRSRLGEAGEAVQRFLDSGLSELGDKLGPVLWQLPPTHRYDADDFTRFADLLPERLGRLRLRHAIEVRHASFNDARFFSTLRDRNLALVFADSPQYPRLDQATADFSYARYLCSAAAQPEGYAPHQLDAIATTAQARSGPAFVFFINGAKERAPAAAQALLHRLRAAR